MCRFPKACCLLGFDNRPFFVRTDWCKPTKKFRRVRFFVQGRYGRVNHSQATPVIAARVRRTRGSMTLRGHSGPRLRALTHQRRDRLAVGLRNEHGGLPAPRSGDLPARTGDDTGRRAASSFELLKGTSNNDFDA